MERKLDDLAMRWAQGREQTLLFVRVKISDPGVGFGESYDL